MRISDWRSDGCSSDLHGVGGPASDDRDRPGIAAMLDGVGDEVEQNMMKQPLVGPDERQAGGNLKIDMVAAQHILEVVDDAGDRIGQVDRRHAEMDAPGVDSHQFDQIVAKTAQARQLDRKSTRMKSSQ